MKVKVDINGTFQEGQKYEFKSSSESVYLKYIGQSRIDGYQLFYVCNKTNNPIANFSYNSNKIKNIELVSDIQIHLPLNNYHENRERLLDYILDKYNIKEEDLFDENEYKNVIRRIKLNDLLI